MDVVARVRCAKFAPSLMETRMPVKKTARTARATVHDTADRDQPPSADAATAANETVITPAPDAESLPDALQPDTAPVQGEPSPVPTRLGVGTEVADLVAAARFWRQAHTLLEQATATYPSGSAVVLSARSEELRSRAELLTTIAALG